LGVTDAALFLVGLMRLGRGIERLLQNPV